MTKRARGRTGSSRVPRATKSSREKSSSVSKKSRATKGNAKKRSKKQLRTKPLSPQEQSRRVLKVLKAWSKGTVSARARSISEDSSLHELGQHSLLRHVAAVFEGAPGFNTEAFLTGWNDQPPTKVRDLIAKVAEHTSTPPANYKKR